VVAALNSVVDLARPDDVLICPPIVLELGFSARTGPDRSAHKGQIRNTIIPWKFTDPR
jgi:hypothetical protein